MGPFLFQTLTSVLDAHDLIPAILNRIQRPQHPFRRFLQALGEFQIQQVPIEIQRIQIA